MRAGKKTVTISYHGEDLEVCGWYSPYVMGTMEQPPEDEDFEIGNIKWKDKDVTDLVIALLPNLDQITQLCIDKLNN